MKIEKSIKSDKTLHISFTFNPEEYVLKDWEIIDKVNKILVAKIIKSVEREHLKEIMAFFKENKKQIIERTKKELTEQFKDRIQKLCEE